MCVLYTFIIMQGSFALFVTVIDDDFTVNAPDFVDMIVISKSLAESSSFTAPETFIGLYNNGRMTLSFRVQCSQGEDSTSGTGINAQERVFLP